MSLFKQGFEIFIYIILNLTITSLSHGYDKFVRFILSKSVHLILFVRIISIKMTFIKKILKLQYKFSRNNQLAYSIDLNIKKSKMNKD